MRWLVLLLAVGCSDIDTAGLDGPIVALCEDQLICAGWCLRDGGGVTDHDICLPDECHEGSACCVPTEAGVTLDVPEELCADCPICYLPEEM